ncbi:unnamed protein product [Peronospora effusa]|nr:unnamed protein product [Peronospora effusa]
MVHEDTMMARLQTERKRKMRNGSMFALHDSDSEQDDYDDAIFLMHKGATVTDDDYDLLSVNELLDDEGDLEEEEYMDKDDEDGDDNEELDVSKEEELEAEFVKILGHWEGRQGANGRTTVKEDVETESDNEKEKYKRLQGAEETAAELPSVFCCEAS